VNLLVVQGRASPTEACRRSAATFALQGSQGAVVSCVSLTSNHTLPFVLAFLAHLATGSTATSRGGSTGVGAHHLIRNLVRLSFQRIPGAADSQLRLDRSIVQKLLHSLVSSLLLQRQE
jgi:hypothetical protein